MDTIDLRSDTVSWPTDEMRAAMAQAEVGDDVYGEDPTLNRLEEEAASMLGKEAALFVTSGTMGNLTALLTHCGRGEEVILGKQAHIFRSEAANAAAFGGIQLNTLEVNEDGTLDLDEIQAAIRGDDQHMPRTRLIALENTQGTLRGVLVSAAYTDAVGDLAHEHGLKLHIDGARIFNAAAALGTSASELVAAAGQRLLLSLQGTLRASGFTAARRRGVHPGRASHTQGAGRRATSGWHSGSRRTHCPAQHAATPARGSH